MRIRILGSAAGGGLPQWNCRCPNCQAARERPSAVRPRMQSSVAVSADGDSWFLLNVSVDIGRQLSDWENLWPPVGSVRGTRIAGCILTDAEIDHTSGLLQLREGCRLGIFSTRVVRRWLNRSFPIEPILNSFAERPWTEFPLELPFDLSLPNGTTSGLRLTAFELGRDVPRYVPEDPDGAVGSVIGLKIEDSASGGTLVYAPGVPDISRALRSAAEKSDCLLLDGTFWSNDELNRHGISTLTAAEMGHVPISGPGGTLDWLSGLRATHRVYVHLNNTNPVLRTDSPEHQQVVSAGVRVGHDGEMIEI